MQEKVHFVEVIHQQAEKLAKHTALYYKKNDQWQGLCWQAFKQKIDQLSLALLAHNINEQDKIGIFAHNMPEWTITDFATLQIRAVTVPIYATNTENQTRYIINDAGIRILFVGSQDEYDIALSIAEQCPTLEKIVAMQHIDLHNAEMGYHWEDFINTANPNGERVLAQRVAQRSFDDLFTLIYTSGTTGEPKGVMLDYHNLAHQLLTHKKALMKIDENDTSLSFLPFSHIFERAWVAYILYCGAINAYVEDPHQVREAMNVVKPTLMCAVPRFYEKIYCAINDKVSKAPFFRRKIFHFALKIGTKVQCYRANKQKQPLWFVPFYRLADKLVLKKLRDLLGGRIRMMPCGGAKLDPEIGSFFHSIGINIKLGYGMTETTATVSCWDDNHFEPNSIGQIMPGTEVKIGDDNEILVKGGGVMRGYYNKPEQTAEAFTADGFLKTGDAGYIDEQGNLFITDRIKELMKTSNGKYIAPQVLEGKIGKDNFVEQIAIIADAKKYVSALIVPSFEALEEYAKQLNIKYQDHVELIKHSKIVELFEKRIQELQKELPSFEQIKKFTLLPQAFSTKLEEITPTLKLRRKVIMERYHHLIEKMYKPSNNDSENK